MDLMRYLLLMNILLFISYYFILDIILLLVDIADLPVLLHKLVLLARCLSFTIGHLANSVHFVSLDFLALIKLPLDHLILGHMLHALNVVDVGALQ